MRAQHHRRRHAGERVDGADRQIDAAGDDDDRRADGHDREEAGVGRGLDERVRVEEVVDRQAGARVDVRARKDCEDAASSRMTSTSPACGDDSVRLTIDGRAYRDCGDTQTGQSRVDSYRG